MAFPYFKKAVDRVPRYRMTVILSDAHYEVASKQVRNVSYMPEKGKVTV